MQAGRRHEVAHVVHLEVETILERLGGRIAIALANQNGCVDVSVVTLRGDDRGDGGSDGLAEFLILRDGVGGDSRFEPFVKIAVIPLCAVVISCGLAASNQEVFEERFVGAITHEGPHRGD